MYDKQLKNIQQYDIMKIHCYATPHYHTAHITTKSTLRHSPHYDSQHYDTVSQHNGNTE